MRALADQAASCPETQATQRFLTPQVVRRLEDALSRVGAFGEVRLVVLKGRLRFVETVRSESLAEGPSGEVLAP
jgi:hypothetical protein